MSNKRFGKGLIGWLTTLVILGICCFFVFSNFDLHSFQQALSGRAAWTYAVAAVLFIPTYLPQGLRLYLVLRRRCGWLWCLRGAFLGAGANTLLPARLGDVVKAGYLAAHCRVPFSFTLCGVFWERLSDVTAVLVLTGVLGWHFDFFALALSPLLMLVAILTGLWLVCRWPLFFLHCLARLPNGNIRSQLEDAVATIADKRAWPPLPLLFAASLGIWLCFCIFTTLFLAFFQGQDTNFFLGALITLAGAIGMMLPGAPAGAGTYEASVVAAMMLAGQDKSEALAFAAVLHIIQIVPCALYAAFAALRGQWSPSGKGVAQALARHTSGESSQGRHD